MSGISRREIVLGGALAAVAAFDTSRRDSIAAAGALPADPYSGAVTLAIDADFPGIDPSGAADSSVGLQAALDATVSGGTVLVPPGRYRIGAALAPSGGKTLRLQGYGATLLAAGDGAVISLRGEYDPIIQVSSAQLVRQTFASGASESTSVLTLASEPGWVPGDVVKVVSDDSIAGAREAGNRRGEFATVLSSSGRQVTLTGRLREDYATNVRVARISRQTIRVEGFDVHADDSRMGRVGDALLSFSRLFDPLIADVRVTRASGSALRFSSCFGYRVEHVDVSYAMDAPAQGVLGYGVLDNSSSFGRIVGGTYRNVRHAYTDDTPAVSAGDPNVAAYGRTYGTVLLGVHAVGTTSAAFSPHHSSEGVQFEACRATGGVPMGASAVGFELRGRRHRVSSCSAVNLSNGVLVRTESGGGESRGHVISDFRAESMSNAAVNVSIHPSGHPAAKVRDTELNARIDGVTAIDCQRLVYAENANLSISGSHYVAPRGMESQLLEGFFLRNSDVSIRDVVLDYTQCRAGAARPVIAGSSTGFQPGRQESTIDGLEIKVTPEVAARAYFVFGGVEHRIQAAGIRISHPFPRVPGESHADTSWTWSVDARPGVVNSGLSSSRFAIKSTALAAQLVEVLKSDDREVWIHLDSEGKAVQLAQMPAGRRPGQRWTFFQSSAGSVRFASGGTSRMSLKGGVARTLTKGFKLELMWDGSTWHEPVSL